MQTRRSLESRPTSVPTTSSNAIGFGTSWRMNLSSVCEASSITRRLARVASRMLRPASSSVSGQKLAVLGRGNDQDRFTAFEPGHQETAHGFGQRPRRVEELQMVLGRSRCGDREALATPSMGELAGSNKPGHDEKAPISSATWRPPPIRRESGPSTSPGDWSWCSWPSITCAFMQAFPRADRRRRSSSRGG